MPDDLNSHALRLLKFIEDSVAEALASPASMLEPLSEADCALRVLQKTLLREGEQGKLRQAQLSLIGVFDPDFVQIAKDNQPNQTAKLKEALVTVLLARDHFPSTA